MALNAQNCPRPFFHRFWSIFRRFSIIFSTIVRAIFVRISSVSAVVLPVVCSVCQYIHTSSKAAAGASGRAASGSVWCSVLHGLWVVLLLVLCGARCCISCASRFAVRTAKRKKLTPKFCDRPSLGCSSLHEQLSQQTLNFRATL